MKKILSVLFVLLLSLGVMFTMASCSEDDNTSNGDSNPPAHTHTASSPVMENEVAATCTTEGSYDLVTYCSACNAELTRENKVIEKIAHTPAAAVEENKVNATCTTEGSYDLVTYCSVCNTELSKENKVIEKIAHTPAVAVEENKVDATCTTEGSYDLVTYCSVCNTELSRENKVIEKIAHTPAAAVEENKVDATCTTEGSYDLVTYCSVCEAEISRTAKVIDALGHTPAAAVEENKVDATCTEDGSYYEVVNCSACAVELSRDLKVEEKLGHQYKLTSLTYPTAFEDGLSVYTCERCPDSYDEVTPATGAIKILVIGDSSTSSTISYIDEIMLANGVKTILVGTANCNHSTGASISDHWKNISKDKKAYTYTPTVNGTIGKIVYTQKLSDILAFENWDYIIISQSIPEAGNEDAYAELENYLAFLNESKPFGAKILWNMPWAYNKNSTHTGFAAYDYNQETMYAAILEAMNDFVFDNESINAILPIGAAVQNLRTTFFDGSIGSAAGIALENEIGSYIYAVTWCSHILGKSASELSSAITSDELNGYEDVIDSAIVGAFENPTTITKPAFKSFKILIFGNSYSNDAISYLSKIFLSAGYHEIIIGSITDGGCDINHHWWNIDENLEDYHPAAQYDGMTGVEGTAGCLIYNNGKSSAVKADTLKERYIKTISAYEWDYVSIQHGPNTVEKTDTYSYLTNLIEFVEEHLISEETKFVYHMIWKYNDNLSSSSQHTSYQYNNILDITHNLVLKNEQFENRVIPAATFRQNLVSSYLTDVDISRDYGHMGLTLGRYALGLLWYCYFTGGSVDDVTYVPTADDVSAEEKTKYKNEYGHTHLEITEEDMLIVKEAIENALANPYEITQSVYTEKPAK